MKDLKRLEDLYLNVRNIVQSGNLTNFKKSDIHDIDKLVKAKSIGCSFTEDTLQYAFFKLRSHLQHVEEENRKLEEEERHTPKALKKRRKEPSIINNPLYLKAFSLSLEFRDALGELKDDEHWKHLSRLARQFLDEFAAAKSRPLLLKELESLKEKARLVSIYANQLRRQSQPERAKKAVESAKDMIKQIRRLNRTQCNTVLGGLYYVESKLLRNEGQHRECEDRLTKAIWFYSEWMRRPRSRNPANVQLASYYKIAMFLGHIAWSKNNRGFCTDALALIHAARLMILSTDWELDKAHLNLIYADIRRAFIGTDKKLLEETIKLVDESYKAFERHQHIRMKSRAAFTLALLNFYADNLHRATEKLKEVEQFSSKTKDTTWLVNYRILLARILIKQNKAKAALTHLDEAISEAKKDKLNERLIVARIVKGEALRQMGNYPEAIKSLNEAARLNERRIGDGVEINSERNKKWILLALAQTYLLTKDILQAKTYLESSDQLVSVEYEWLNELANDLRREVQANLPEGFIIENDVTQLDWRKHKTNLALWLIEQAKLKARAKTNEDIAAALGISVRTLTNLKKSR